MAIEVKIPSVGESIQEAVLVEWFKKDGDDVELDEPLFVIETDKVTLEITAEEEGILKILIAEGETVKIGAVVGMIEPSEARVKDTSYQQGREKETVREKPVQPADEVEPLPGEAKTDEGQLIVPGERSFVSGPSVRRLVADKNIDTSKIIGTGPGGRITKGDVLIHIEQAGSADRFSRPAETKGALEILPAVQTVNEERRPMTPIRKRIAQRLLESKQNTAMLTTFNEIDMSHIIEIRHDYKEGFKKRHGVSLGFMSFFMKACVEALREIPEINAFVDGDDIIYHHYQHIGVAIGAERGLVVPVIRDVQNLSFAAIEKAIIDFVEKINGNRLELSDLEGGTFTVSNGGVYGSLLSTPILNTPQSGILGMHKIEKRPVVIDDQIVIRPMMYVAVSYDHRIVDGKGAVTFLRRIKEFIEDPERMVLEV